MTASVRTSLLPSTQTIAIDAAAFSVLALITGAVYFASVRPYKDAIEETRQVELAVADAEAALARATTDADRTRSSLRAAHDQLSRQRITLDPITQANTRLAAVAALASDRDVTLSRIQPGDIKTGARFIALPIRLEGRGQWTGITGFIEAMHERFPDIAVIGLELGAQGPENNEPERTTLSCDLVWYAGPANASVKP